MKRLFALCLLCYSQVIFAQKPPLDTEALSAWPEIDNQAISNDGKYVSYTIGPEGMPAVIYLQATDRVWKREFGFGMDNAFTGDNRRFIFRSPGDSLFIFQIDSNVVHSVGNVRYYKIPPDGNGRWLGYILAGGEMVLKDLFLGAERRYSDVQDFTFSRDGSVLVLQGGSSVGNKTNWLKWIDVDKGTEKAICTGSLISNLTFDGERNQLAFVASHKDGENNSSCLRLFRPGMDSAKILMDSTTSGMEEGFIISNDELLFSADGKKLFFKLVHFYSKPSGPVKVGASVDIWNYRDEFLASDQIYNPLLSQVEKFEGIYSFVSGKVLRLQRGKDAPAGREDINLGGNANYLLTENVSNTGESLWKTSERPNFDLVNTGDGKRTELCRHLLYGRVSFSDSGLYAWWFDVLRRAYFTYNIYTRVIKNVSAKVTTSLGDESNDLGAAPAPPFGDPIWLHHDSVLLLYDHYDIWKIDPSGALAPENLTKGFGKSERIVLRFVYTMDKERRRSLLFKSNGDLILCGLDENSKNNGFYSINVNHPGTPVKLYTAPALIYFSGSSSHVNFPRDIWKAKDAEIYMLTKMSVTDYPNLNITKDFKMFHAITALQPQENYNWMTSEIIRWTTFKGSQAEGILYKPENFNPQNKYPVIIHYYERMSDGLNRFCDAEFCSGSMNIPWFVSRGYLVFCPDIFYRSGDPGAGIYDYVVSAAKAIRRKPWIDFNRVGIQGHSFGGFETDYLVTRTNIFAAAASSAGVSDLVSLSGGAGFGTSAGQSNVESGQFRMGGSLWQKKDSYIRNSAVFQADRVETPLLILQNRSDSGIPWGQGVEFFTALRRLGRSAWMLQYDGAGHNLDWKNAVDYTIRLTQFFDHFLKKLPEPKWMSVGVPGRFKGTDEGFEVVIDSVLKK